MVRQVGFSNKELSTYFLSKGQHDWNGKLFHIISFIFNFQNSMTWKIGGSSWKEWHVQVSASKTSSLAQLLLSFLGSLNLPTLLIFSPGISLKRALRLHLVWLSLSVTLKPERLLMLFIKAVSIFQNLKWANLQDLNRLMIFIMSTKESHSSQI